MISQEEKAAEPESAVPVEEIPAAVEEKPVAEPEVAPVVSFSPLEIHL